MPADPRFSRMRRLMAPTRARVKTDDPESGALSLEWVAIAIVLVATALALAIFLSGKLDALESLIGS
jgi:hypothetical protein